MMRTRDTRNERERESETRRITGRGSSMRYTCVNGRARRDVRDVYLARVRLLVHVSCAFCGLLWSHRVLGENVALLLSRRRGAAARATGVSEANTYVFMLTRALIARVFV